jgi:hypothetical protein
MNRCRRLALALAVLLSPSLLAQNDVPLRRLIDEDVQKAWKHEKITPAPKADAAAFLRRVSLDLVGVIPTAEEVRTFLDDNDPKKREKLIERLLADPRFATHQADVWDLALFGRHPQNYEATHKRDAFHSWLSGKFAKGEGHDRWVRELLVASEGGPEIFHVQFVNQPTEETVAVSRIFLGTQLQCARCHDHPFDSLTQKDFYGMAGFFARMVFIDGGVKEGRRQYLIGEKNTGDVLFTGPVKEQKPGQKGEPVKPKFLGGAALVEPPLPPGFKEPELKGAKAPPKPLFSRREKLADWLVAADNPYFARAAVNRIWAQFLGRGLVHPVDDIGGKNPPSHPALLDALTARFVKSKFDTKALIRELVSSETYQLAATGAGTEALPRWFERARVRPLSAEELLASIRAATGTKENKNAGGVEEYFARAFGEPTNGQGDFQGSLNEHLFLNHSDQVRRFLYRQPGNLTDRLITSKEPWEKKVDLLFLTMLSRMPKETERKRFTEHLTSNPKADALVEEAIWVLLNTAEFRFNH